MEDLKSQVFTREQVIKKAKSTFNQSIKKYSKITKGNTFQSDLIGNDNLPNEANTSQNISVVNEQRNF